MDTQAATSAVPIKVFISYARLDDNDFHFVDPFVQKLRAFVRARSGRELDVTIDRETRWGIEWRERLFGSVVEAGAFIPMLTPSYLASEYCREEFLTFNAKAEQLGVPKLLLPVIPFESTLLSYESEDEVVRAALTRQYLALEEAILAGYESPAWLTVLLKAASELVERVAEAEGTLSEAPSPLPGATTYVDITEVIHSADALEVAIEEDDERPGLAELGLQLANNVNAMTTEAEGIVSAMNHLAEVAQAETLATPLNTAAAYNAWGLRVASAFKPPCEDLERHGKALRVATSEANQVMLEFEAIAERVGPGETRNALRSGLSDVAGNANGEGLGEVVDTIQEMLNTLRPMEELSVPMRRVMAKARAGIKATEDAVLIVQAWERFRLLGAQSTG